MDRPDVAAFFDEATFTVSYVVTDPTSGACAVVDSVLDYDAAAGRTSTASADSVIEHVRARDLHVLWHLETHVHADHLSAAPYLKEALGGEIVIGDGIVRVQNVFAEIFNAGADFLRDGSQFDRLLGDEATLPLGEMELRALHTPGHTPACMTYVVGNAAFVGDTLFMPDYGTARADFPGGDAAALYRSIQRLYQLPAETRVFVCHDYKAPGRDCFAWETTIAEEREGNRHIRNGVSEAAFVKMRTDRDAGLNMPALMLPSVQVNMRAGALPPPEANGVRYIKIPLNAL